MTKQFRVNMKFNVPVEPVLRIHALNTCQLLDHKPPFFFRGEFHPFWELVYVTEGELTAASEERIYTMRKGDLIFHKPMEFHRIWSMENQELHALVIGFCAGSQILDDLGGRAFVLSPGQQATLDSLAEFLHANFPYALNNYLNAIVQTRGSNAALIQLFVNRLELLLVSLALQNETLQVKEHSAERDAQLYRRIVELLNAHIADGISMDEIARTLGCSTASIKRSFAKYSDIGIHKYLLKLKISAAMQMLQAGMTSGEISRQLSFSNQNYFSSVFKRETGQTPSEFRSSTIPGE